MSSPRRKIAPQNSNVTKYDSQSASSITPTVVTTSDVKKNDATKKSMSTRFVNLMTSLAPATIAKIKAKKNSPNTEISDDITTYGGLTELNEKNSKKFTKAGDIVQFDLEGEAHSSDEVQNKRRSQEDSKLDSISRPKTGISELHKSGYGVTEDSEPTNSASSDAKDAKLDPKAHTKKILETISTLNNAMKAAASKSNGKLSVGDYAKIFTGVVTLIKEEVTKAYKAFNVLSALVSNMSDLNYDQLKGIKAKMDELSPTIPRFSEAVNNCKYITLETSVREQAKQVATGVETVQATISSFAKTKAPHFQPFY